MNVSKHGRQMFVLSVTLNALLVTTLLAQDVAVPLVLDIGPVHEAVVATESVTIESALRIAATTHRDS